MKKVRAFIGACKWLFQVAYFLFLVIVLFTPLYLYTLIRGK